MFVFTLFFFYKNYFTIFRKHVINGVLEFRHFREKKGKKDDDASQKID